MSNPPVLHPIQSINGQPAWRHALAQCGLPIHVALIDFETHFDADYHMGIDGAALSTIEYIQDHRFEEICHSIIHIRQPWETPAPSIWWGHNETYIRYLQNEYGSDLEGVTVVAQNLVFDGCILSRKYGITPCHSIDILGLARHEEPRDHNDLDALSERNDLPCKGDTSRFKGLHLAANWDRVSGRPPKLIHRGMTPEEKESMGEYVTRDTWNEWQIFTRLMPRLSNGKVEAALMQHTMEMFWKPTLRVDPVFAVELAAKMEKRIEEVVEKVGASREDIRGNIKFGGLLDAALMADGDSITKYQKDGKPKKDGTPVKLLAIAKDDPQLEQLQIHRSENVRQLIAARSAVKSWPLHIARVERIARQAKAAGGLFPNPLKYCGAHTGRWAGGERVNTQNLPSRNPEEIINSMRGLFMAPEGYDLVIADASQIEARITDWLGGEEKWLKVWADPSRDPYCEFAALICGRPIRKDRKTDPKPLAAYYKKMRGMGKVGVLGCGYGMGADKAVAYAENSYGVTMTVPEAHDLVKAYRQSHANVCKLWRVVEQKFKAAVKYGEDSCLDNIVGFHREGEIAVIILPSGRTLKYPGVKVSIVNGQDRIWMPSPLDHKKIFMWGGYLVENIVQAIARDVLALGVLATEAKGHHVAHHVHDEIVAVVPKDKSKQAFADITEILSTPPVWLPGCPLGAEGGIKERYGK